MLRIALKGSQRSPAPHLPDHNACPYTQQRPSSVCYRALPRQQVVDEAVIAHPHGMPTAPASSLIPSRYCIHRLERHDIVHRARPAPPPPSSPGGSRPPRPDYPSLHPCVYPRQKPLRAPLTEPMTKIFVKIALSLHQTLPTATFSSVMEATRAKSRSPIITRRSQSAGANPSYFTTPTPADSARSAVVPPACNRKKSPKLGHSQCRFFILTAITPSIRPKVTKNLCRLTDREAFNGPNHRSRTVLWRKSAAGAPREMNLAIARRVGCPIFVRLFLLAAVVTSSYVREENE